MSRQPRGHSSPICAVRTFSSAVNIYKWRDGTKNTWCLSTNQSSGNPSPFSTRQSEWSWGPLSPLVNCPPPWLLGSRSGSEPRPHGSTATSREEIHFSFQNRKALHSNLEFSPGGFQSLHPHSFVALGQLVLSESAL